MALLTAMEAMLVTFIIERHRVYKARASGKPKPWTADPIIRNFRFCNVYRELDAVTVWIAKNWREPNAEHPDLWFTMLVARYINQPTTLACMEVPLSWDANDYFHAIRSVTQAGGTVFNAAYIIPPTAGSKVGGTTVGGPKHEALARFFSEFWKQRAEMRPRKGEDLADLAKRLCTMPGMGSFFAGQVIADLKYAQMKDATDWWTFAVSGPGSRRGLNRVRERPVDKGWDEQEWADELGLLRTTVNKHLKTVPMPKLHGQDMQNCLCEFDKWMRAKTGEGKPKQKYDGA